MEQGTYRVKAGLAEMLKGGVIMDVTTPEQAIIAEEAGACAVMALERVPASMLEASADLGAGGWRTLRSGILPLALPGVVAGSIFTFSLTLGDYIIPGVIGNSSPFIGMAVFSYQGTSGNIPLAAAFTVLPIVIMIVYLLLARRTGAFDAL